MGRILGIDYGLKRTGVAVTDPLHIVASALATVPTHQLMTFILDYVKREAVERIVVGQPSQLNGQPSASMQHITPFVKRLQRELPGVPVSLYDERFTSTLAHRAMLDGGMKKSDRRDKARVDSIAATIILNDWLQSVNNTGDCQSQQSSDINNNTTTQ